MAGAYVWQPDDRFNALSKLSKAFGAQGLMTSVRTFERSGCLAFLVLGLGFGSATATFLGASQCRLTVLEASGESIMVAAEGIRSIKEIGRVGISFSTYGISSRSTFVNVSCETMPTIDRTAGSLTAFTERGGVASSIAESVLTLARMRAALIMIALPERILS
jgi:hypothetical protein